MVEYDIHVSANSCGTSMGSVLSTNMGSMLMGDELGLKWDV